MTTKSTARQYALRQQVLVTGGAGFIGSYLCHRLLAEGNHVICVDNYFTGSRRNIQDLLQDPNFEVMRHDVTFPLYVESIKSTTWPVRRLRFTISTIPYRPPRPACME